MDTMGGANCSDGIPPLVNRLTIVVLTVMLLLALVLLSGLSRAATLHILIAAVCVLVARPFRRLEPS